MSEHREQPIHSKTRWVAVLVIAVILAAVLVVAERFWETSNEEGDKRAALEISQLSQFISISDVFWVSVQTEASGETYRYFARVRDSDFDTASIEIPSDADLFVRRDTLPAQTKGGKPVYRTVSLFRDSDKLAVREVSLVVGVSTVDKALAG